MTWKSWINVVDHAVLVGNINRAKEKVDICWEAHGKEIVDRADEKYASGKLEKLLKRLLKLKKQSKKMNSLLMKDLSISQRKYLFAKLFDLSLWNQSI